MLKVVLDNCKVLEKEQKTNSKNEEVIVKVYRDYQIISVNGVPAEIASEIEENEIVDFNVKLDVFAADKNYDYLVVRYDK